MKKPTKKTVDRWAAHDGAMLKKGAEIERKKIADWMKTKLPADHWLVTQIESGAYDQESIPKR